MSTESTTLQITFIDEEEFEETDPDLVAATEENAEILLELDDDANANATTFSPGTPVYVKQYPSGEFTMTVNTGSVTKTRRNVTEAISSETIYFTNENSATLDYLPSGGVTYSWVGTDLGNPVFNGKTITIPNTGVGVLECSYTKYYDQLQVLYSGTSTTTVLLVVSNGDSEDSILIPYTAAGGTAVTTRAVTITVKDYCSDGTVAGANVELSADGFPTQNFTTDANGQAVLGNLTVGTTYNVKITATGYRDSDQDSLSNESFTVTAEE